ncbi:hypothetical protein GCM10009116_00320 [Brevundimonas basaltis]
MEPKFLTGGGDMGGRIRAHDWTATPLGAADGWPLALKALVEVMLGSSQPMFIAWGPGRTLLYNDAYMEILASKHPAALGADFLQAWHEIRANLEPIVFQAFAGEPVQMDDIELWMERRGYREETHFAFSYTPVRDESGEVAGFFCACREITGQIMAERQLRASEAMARENSERVQLALAAGAIIGTWVWDIPADQFSVDQAFAEAFGLDPALGREGFSLDQVMATVHPDDREGLTAAVEQAVASGDAYAHQYRVKRADGRYYWIEANGRVERADDGTPLRFPGVLLDIEERRRTQAALTETAERYRLAARATRDAIWDWDFATNLVLWNDAVRELFGYSQDEVGPDAEWWVSRIHPDDRERVTHSIHAVIDGTGSDWTDEYRFLTADGSHVYVLDRGYVIRDAEGRATRMIGAMLDLTERRRAESLLKQSNDRFRAAVDAVEGILWTNDADGRMVGEQPGWAALTGQSFEDYQGYGWAGAVHPDDAQPTIDAWEQAVAARSMFVFEHRLKRADGQWRLFSIRAVPSIDANGQIREWVGVHTDITEQRAVERSLRDLNETLEERVSREVAERESAQEALRQSQKMEAVGQLTGGIAHDFNNLLTVVLGNVNLAVRTLREAGGNPRIERLLGSAQKGGERAAALTQRLLAFSRRQPLAPKVVEVDALAVGMSDLLHRSLGETIELDIVTSPGLWRIEADPNQLEASLLNLAVNARDAMPDGGRLTIETSNVQLDESDAARRPEVAPGHYVCITVSDTGSGIPSDVLGKVFEPFFTTKEVGKGTGLGLSMVYGFARQSGGHVDLQSEPGEGATVRLYLPRMAQAPDAADAAETAPRLEPGASSETILVVEDDDDVRTFTVEVLRGLGYRVLEAHDGVSAIRLLERQARAVDLLFTDVVMPGMSGGELATAARELRPDIRVLFTSGYTRNAIGQDGRLKPGTEMIAKPFTAELLAARLRDMLDQPVRAA